MGKQPQHKNKTARVQRTKGSATFTVKGHKYTVQSHGNTNDAVAAHVGAQGFIPGSVVNLNGSRYALRRDFMGDWKLEAIGGGL